MGLQKLCPEVSNYTYFFIWGIKNAHLATMSSPPLPDQREINKERFRDLSQDSASEDRSRHLAGETEL